MSKTKSKSKVTSLEEAYKRRQAKAAEHRRNRQIEELKRAAERPSVMPSAKAWIQRQIEQLRSGNTAA